MDTQGALKRQRLRAPADPVLDRAVWDWFTAKRAEGTPISGPILQAQAVQMATHLHGEGHGFLGTKGWLARWQQRHGVRSIKISGEIRSGDTAAAEAFIPELERLVEERGLSPTQI